MATVTGTHAVVVALHQHGEDMELGVGRELARLAQEAAARMHRLAPTWRSALVNSVQADQVEPLAWHVGPHVDYAGAVEDGVRPGGRGLPRFFSPEASSIKAWLSDKAFAGRGRVRKGSRAAVLANLELRDRYEGLAWHVRHRGVKARPFVAPVAREMEPVMLARLDLAVRRVLAARGPGDAGGGTFA